MPSVRSQVVLSLHQGWVYSRGCVCVHVCVCACVCQVHEAEHTEAHTVGQTRHNIIIPDIDLVSAELEGKTCTPAVHTRLSRTHRDMCRHTHSRTEKYNLWMHGNTHTHTHKYIELYVHQLSLEPSVMSFWSTSSRNSAKHMPSIWILSIKKKQHVDIILSKLTVAISSVLEMLAIKFECFAFNLK